MIKKKLTGVLKFGRILKPVTTKFGKDVYQLTLTVEKALFDMFKMDLQVNEDLDMGKYKVPHKVQADGSVDVYFQVTAKGRKKDGEEFDKAPKLVDKAGEAVDKLKLGNGSTIKVEMTVFNYDFEKPNNGGTVSGIQLQPTVITVLDLVEFAPKKPLIGEF